MDSEKPPENPNKVTHLEFLEKLRLKHQLALDRINAQIAELKAKLIE